MIPWFPGYASALCFPPSTLPSTIRMGCWRRAATCRPSACPRHGQSGTWITPQVIDAYTALHEQGHAHSVEAWREGALVGGLYGVAIGRMFYGESMFARESDASKVALVKLVAMLKWMEM